MSSLKASSFLQQLINLLHQMVHRRNGPYNYAQTNFRLPCPGAGAMVFSLWGRNFYSIPLICDLGSVSSPLRTLAGTRKLSRTIHNTETNSPRVGLTELILQYSGACYHLGTYHIRLARELSPREFVELPTDVRKVHH